METWMNYHIDGKLKVTHRPSVVVVGGGPGGLGAAVMAARAGADVVLVERYGCLGGMATIGEVHPFMPNRCHQQPLDGPVYLDWVQAMYGYFTDEKGRETRREQRLNLHNEVHRHYAALAAEDLCLQAGVTILYHHTLADVILEGRNIAGLVLLSKSGYTAIQADIYIDCSGDGDLAARANCSYEFGGPGGYCQPMTTCFKLQHVDKARMPERTMINRLYDAAKGRGEIRCPREDVLFFGTLEADVVHFNTTRMVQKNAVDGVELSDAEVEGHRQIREYLQFLRREVPGFECAELASMAAQVGVRESRRILGHAYLTRSDFENCSHFEDAIARVWYQIDIHNPIGSGSEIVKLKEGDWYEIPYGCIVPKDCDNLLVGGRPISVDHAIHSSMRVMPPACSIGSAAGMAAALGLQSAVPVAALDGRVVRAALRERGAYL